jgi:hypothetical protein
MGNGQRFDAERAQRKGGGKSEKAKAFTAEAQRTQRNAKSTAGSGCATMPGAEKIGAAEILTPAHVGAQRAAPLPLVDIEGLVKRSFYEGGDGGDGELGCVEGGGG